MVEPLPEVDLMYMAESLEQAILRDWVMFDLTPEILDMYKTVTIATIQETPATIKARGEAYKKSAQAVSEVMPSLFDLIAG